MKKHSFVAILILVAVAAALPAKKPARKGPARAHAAAKAKVSAPQVDDATLVDWRRQPFSDFASHGVLVRQPQGLLAWKLRSALAFGTLAAHPNGAKELVSLRLDVVVEGESAPRFAAQAVTLSSYPRWAQESVQDGPLRAEAVTVFAGPDLMVAAANIKNVGKTPLRVRPRLQLQRSAEGLSAKAAQPRSEPALLLGLDRSAAAGRRLLEHVALQMGGQSGRAAWQTPGQLKEIPLGKADALPAGQDLALELTWPVPQLLAPGQSLRVPVLAAWGQDEAALQKQAAAAWRESALPVGKAWSAAQARWAATKSRLPLAADPQRQRLLDQACLDLILSAYGARAALSADQFSAQKGTRDSFSSVDSPLAALGWAELDHGKAEDAVLDLASFSAAAPAPLPPDSGDEKLAWEAAGLPLHAWAAWELYHRDPEATRAASFLGKFGQRLRNECAWWPEARDGDHNGLYAFARDEEMPTYLRRLQGGLPVLLAPPTPGAAPIPSLQTWSLALSSLVAWQYQAASALAGAAGDPTESNRWLELCLKTKGALATEAWDPAAKSYRQGLDALWFLALGLEEDQGRARDWFEHSLNPALSVGEKPWVEQGVETPWRFYLLARTLAAYGYLDLERELNNRFLADLDKRGVLDSEYGSDPQAWVGGAAGTAGVVSQLALMRQEQDLFLTDRTAEFIAPLVQFRTLDGAFYLKRNRLPDKKAKYADIKIETPNHGPILSENAFILSSDEPLALQMTSEEAMDISDLNRKGALIFRKSHKVELLVQPRTRIQVKFVASDDAK